MLNKLFALLLSAGLFLSPIAGSTAASSSGEPTANVPITVGKQQAVYEKWTAEQDVCTLCKGTGQNEVNTAPLKRCGELCSCRALVMCSLHRDGKDLCGALTFCQATYNHPPRKVKCTTCAGSGKSGYIKGSYISDVTANKDSLPQDGKHADGYWYVFKKLVED